MKKRGFSIVFYNNKLLFSSLVFFIFLFFIYFFYFDFSFTGYFVHEGGAGTVSELEIIRSFPIMYWGGIYGVALRITGFSELLYNEAEQGIHRQDLFFDCLQEGIDGKNEIFASVSDSINFDLLVPGDPQDIDNFTGCSGYLYCALNTFDEQINIEVGERIIENIPATYTYDSEGDPRFVLGLLDDSENLVYVTRVLSIQPGFNPDSVVNYQLMLPYPENTSVKYHFFTDPSVECPTGGVWNMIDSNIYGFVRDIDNNSVSGALISVGGFKTYSEEDGFYNLSVTLFKGDYNFIATKALFHPHFSEVMIDFDSFDIEKDITLFYLPKYNETIDPVIDGYVFDESGNRLAGVEIFLGGESAITNSDGYYVINPYIAAKPHYIIGIRPGYHNYFKELYFQLGDTYLNHNFTMGEIRLPRELFPQDPVYEGDLDYPPDFLGGVDLDYWISPRQIEVNVYEGTFVEKIVRVYNFNNERAVTLEMSSEIQAFSDLNMNTFIIPKNSFREFKIRFSGISNQGTYDGRINLRGGIFDSIPVRVNFLDKDEEVVEEKDASLEVELIESTIKKGNDLRYRIIFKNLLNQKGLDVLFKVSVKDKEGNLYFEEYFEEVVVDSLTLLREISFGEDIKRGNYLLNVEAEYLDKTMVRSVEFFIREISYFLIFLILIIICIVFLFLFLRKRRSFFIQRNKDEGKKFIFANVYGEDTPVFFDLNSLKKSVRIISKDKDNASYCSKVISKNALLENIDVIVFEKDGRWSESGKSKKSVDIGKSIFKEVIDIRTPNQEIKKKKRLSGPKIQILKLKSLKDLEINEFILKRLGELSHEKGDVLIIFDNLFDLKSNPDFISLFNDFANKGVGFLLLLDSIGDLNKPDFELFIKPINEADLNYLRSNYGDDFVNSFLEDNNDKVFYRNAFENNGRPYFIKLRGKDLIKETSLNLSPKENLLKKKYEKRLQDVEEKIKKININGEDLKKFNEKLNMIKEKIGEKKFNLAEIYFEDLNNIVGYNFFVNPREDDHVIFVKTEDLVSDMVEKGVEKFDAYNKLVEDFEEKLKSVKDKNVDVSKIKKDLDVVKEKLAEDKFSIAGVYFDEIRKKLNL